jgi:hypothetical protein
MKLVNLIPLKEIDFRNQDQFDDYVKQHSLRPDTKVTINGKVTTAGQAAQQSKDKAVKGTSVFGKDKGGSVFGGDKSKAKQADTPSKPEPKESTNWSFGALSGPAGWVAANAGTHAGLKPDLSYKDRDDFLGTWADENLIDLNKVADAISNKKLKFTDIATAANGNPGNKYTKDIASKYPLEPKDFEKYPKKAQPEEGSIESLTSYKKLANFYKTNKDKLDKNYVDDIKGQIGALKYLESDYKRGDADWEEVLVAYEELQDLIKKAMSKSGSTKLSSMIPNSTSPSKKINNPTEALPKEIYNKMSTTDNEVGEFNFLSTNDGEIMYGIAKEDGKYYVTLGNENGEILKSFGKTKDAGEAAQIFMKNLNAVKSKYKLDL